MAKSLRTAGMQELDSLKRRVTRQFAMRRITKRAHDELIAELNKIEAMIQTLHEEGGDGNGY